MGPLSFVRALVISGVLALGLAASIAPLIGQQTPSASTSYVPGEVLVRFRAGISASRRDAALSAIGARAIRRFDRVGIQHARVARGQRVEAAVASLMLDPDVLDAQPNYLRTIDAAAPPNDPSWLNDSLWGLVRIQADQVWNTITTGSRAIVIADIDTGVNYTHPDLAPNMWRNPGEIPGNGIDDDGNGYVDDVYGIDTLNHDSDPMDDNGHGTHTAGTLGAVGNNGVGVVGVNWNTSILACKFLSSDGVGSDAGAIECFNYLVALKNSGINVRVTSNSWGALRGPEPSVLLQAAIDAAGAAGIVNVFAAGNNAVNTDDKPFDPASFTSPSIISVANSDSADNRASSSNWGPTSVDLAAPGTGILSTYGAGYTSLTGTSMATPHVAGSAALLIAQRPTLSVSEVKSLILDNVDLMGPWSGRVASGGRLNVYRAAIAVANGGGGAASPDGTRLPPAPQIVDGTGGAWTIAGLVILRNGLDTGGLGSIITWCSGRIHVLGTDSHWWLWQDGWIRGGPDDPCGSASLPPTASPDGARLPPATQIVDGTGAVWTIAGQMILRNGLDTTGLGSIVTWCGGQIRVLGTDSHWWLWAGEWIRGGPTDPCGSASPQSPDGTHLPPASEIVDDTGSRWTIAGNVILRNGQPTDGYGSIIVWCGSRIYVLGTDSQWWQWSGEWEPMGPADPCGG